MKADVEVRRPPMTLKEITHERLKLEDRLALAIQHFEGKTGVPVRAVHTSTDAEKRHLPLYTVKVTT